MPNHSSLQCRSLYMLHISADWEIIHYSQAVEICNNFQSVDCCLLLLICNLQDRNSVLSAEARDISVLFAPPASVAVLLNQGQRANTVLVEWIMDRLAYFVEGCGQAYRFLHAATVAAEKFILPVHVAQGRDIGCSLRDCNKHADEPHSFEI